MENDELSEQPIEIRIGGLRSRGEDSQALCHLCQDIGSQKLDWEKGQSCKAGEVIRVGLNGERKQCIQKPS